MGKISCRLGRHAWEYVIDTDKRDLVVIRGCTRCQKSDRFPARLSDTFTRAAGTSGDRPLPTLGAEGLRSAAALIKATSDADIDAINVLGRHVDDPIRLVLSFCWLIGDALVEPASHDLPGYVQRLFARLDRSQ